MLRGEHQGYDSQEKFEDPFFKSTWKSGSYNHFKTEVDVKMERKFH